MDDLARYHRSSQPPADLASIVLGSADPDRRHDAPEQVPLDHGWREQQPGFDARSAAVLALVVAVLAGLVGWATTIGMQPDPAARPGASGDATTVADVEEPRAAASGTGSTASDAESGAAPTAAIGIDLAIGRIVPAKSASGTGIVAVGVGNRGDRAYAGRPASELLVIVDGNVVASEPIPAVEAGESTRVSVSLDWCPAGTVPVTAVLDSSAAVREADERNNATSRSATFGC